MAKSSEKGRFLGYIVSVAFSRAEKHGGSGEVDMQTTKSVGNRLVTGIVGQ